MERHVYESKERFALSHLTVVINGTVCVGLRIVLKGCVLGEDCLIADAHATKYPRAGSSPQMQADELHRKGHVVRIQIELEQGEP